MHRIDSFNHSSSTYGLGHIPNTQSDTVLGKKIKQKQTDRADKRLKVRA